MGVVNLPRTYWDDSSEAAWFQATIVQASGIVSDVYKMPPVALYAIAVKTTGSGTLAFSIDTPTIIDAGTASFVDWDGLSRVNLGVTAFKFTTTTASGTVQITAKSYHGS